VIIRAGIKVARAHMDIKMIDPHSNQASGHFNIATIAASNLANPSGQTRANRKIRHLLLKTTSL
jgi:hypothetical protein